MLELYLPILIFLIIALGIGIVPILAGLILGKRSPSDAKDAPYECGFEAFEDSRMRFDVRYYLVAILFIIFDLEIAFLFPWAVSFGSLGWLGFVSMMILLSCSSGGGDLEPIDNEFRLDDSSIYCGLHRFPKQTTLYTCICGLYRFK